MSSEYQQAMELVGGATGDSGNTEWQRANSLLPPPETPEPSPQESKGFDPAGWLIGAGENMAALATGAGAEIASGLAGLGTLALGGSLDKAADSVRNVQEYGYDVSTDKGQKIQETIGSALQPIVAGAQWLEENTAGKAADNGFPLAATIIRALPEAVPAAVALRSLRVAARAADKTTSLSKKERLASNDPDLKYDGDLAEVRLNSEGKVVPDRRGIRLTKTMAMNPEMVSVLTNANTVTKARLKGLISSMQKGSQNAVARMTEDINSLFGASVSARIATLSAKRKEIGGKLQAEADRLAGKKVDVSQAVDSFVGEMQAAFGFKMHYTHKGPVLDPKRIPESSFLNTKSGAKARNTLEDVVSLLRTNSNGSVMDGRTAHKLKNMLDEIVDASKAGEGGLSNTVERGILSLRSEINSKLREANPEYGVINDQYTALLKIQQPFNAMLPEGAKWGDKASSQAIGARLKNTTDYGAEGAAIRALDDNLKAQGIQFTDDPLALVQVYKGMQEYWDSPAKLQEYLKANKAALDNKVYDGLASASVGNVFGVIHDAAKMRDLKFSERQIRLVQKRMKEVYGEIITALDQ